MIDMITWYIMENIYIAEAFMKSIFLTGTVT